MQKMRTKSRKIPEIFCNSAKISVIEIRERSSIRHRVRGVQIKLITLLGGDGGPEPI